MQAWRWPTDWSKHVALCINKGSAEVYNWFYYKLGNCQSTNQRSNAITPLAINTNNSLQDQYFVIQNFCHKSMATYQNIHRQTNKHHLSVSQNTPNILLLPTCCGLCLSSPGPLSTCSNLLPKDAETCTKLSYELTSEGSVHHAMHINGVPLSLLLQVKWIFSEHCIQSNKHYIQEENRLHVSAKMIIHHQT